MSRKSVTPVFDKIDISLFRVTQKRITLDT